MDRTDNLEELINNSAVFSIDPDKERKRYEKERNRLIANVFMLKVSESRENEEFSMEMIETLKNCIKYYDLSKGPFLNYFNKSFSKKKRIVSAMNAVQADEPEEMLTDEMDSIENSDADLDCRENVEELTDILEEAFNGSRPGARTIISYKVTDLLAVWDRNLEFYDCYSNKSFFEEEIFRLSYMKGGLKNKEIAGLLGKTEANLTQVWHRFIRRCCKDIRNN